MVCGVTLMCAGYMLVFLSRQPDVTLQHGLHHVEAERRLTQVSDQSPMLANQTSACQVTWPSSPWLLNHRWHVQKRQQMMISAFSAFLDTRNWTVPSSSIRVFAVSTSTPSDPIYYQVWTNDFPHPVIMQATTYSTGRGLTKNKTRYFEYLITCPLPFPIQAKYVSLAFDVCENSTISLPVETPKEEDGYTHEFGICVAVSYGDVPPARLIEWVELNRILGVGEINIYNSSLANTSMQVLQSYVEEGIVVIREAPPPIQDWSYWPKKLSVIAALNDCLYRNMYRYRYVIVTDFDEFIIPSRHYNYADLFRNMNREHNLPSYSNPPAFMFRNTYFFLELEQDKTASPYLLTQRYRRRLPVSRAGYAVKSISDPRRCVVMSNHNCLLRTTDVGKYWTLQVNENIASSQHYKRCHFAPHQCRELLQIHFPDNSTSKYAAELERRFQAKFDSLTHLRNLNIDLLRKIH